MNCPSRTNNPLDNPGWNQNPPLLTADLTTRQDLNGIANTRERRRKQTGSNGLELDPIQDKSPRNVSEDVEDLHSVRKGVTGSAVTEQEADLGEDANSGNVSSLPWQNHQSHTNDDGARSPWSFKPKGLVSRTVQTLRKFGQFIGPGFLIAVAYIDPGNYATDVAAGAKTKYALLFVILMSNLFAIFLQSLCIKLGSVTGLNLAENCKAHLPKWLTILLYVFAESAIIATDIAEVVGSAISLNLLFKIPLVAGCAITLVDVLVILIFYKPNGTMTAVRAFEFFVMALVLGVVVCFCIQLSLIKESSVGAVFRGYLPSATVVKDNGLYLSCGILGATVMPHSIFLGSGVVQPRLKLFDINSGYTDPSIQDGSSDEDIKYRPSVHAIRACLKYSVVELALSLFTFALFVNSSILIVAGASLSGSDAGEADLFGIYALLSNTISPAAGTIFATALLLSGISAGIVCTIAGQMVSEGMLNWRVAPWLRRLITRSISIIPSIIIAAAVGKKGLNATLTASQVVLSVILPFVTAPLIYFTSRTRYMTVRTERRIGESNPESEIGEEVSMKNNWLVTILGALIWLGITIMNVALLVLVGQGKA
ncbi:NRAMP-like transporter smf-3 [Emydomyces testavorans]|uniref:NRAMP-like transporter smf-3 n=1 Tax=Emydomyces testavorans TaxID=2070801 RepID=A0AAF0DL28_9EURO|nr:NRAMP-like transporter smf-3 [Emydomyces testavorans]